MESKRIVPNPESKLLAGAVVGGAGLGVPPEAATPAGYAAVVLFVPLTHIVGKNPIEIQEDLGLPWYCEGSEPVWF